MSSLFEESRTALTEDRPQNSASTRDRLAVIAAILFPTLVTWVYFVLLDDADPSLQQISYLSGKCLQFGFPVFWVYLFARRKSQQVQNLSSNLWIGCGFGLVVTATAWLLFRFWLRPSGLFDSAATEIEAKVIGVGVTAVWQYVLLALFYALGHSFLEEYYWRWFVFAELQRFMSGPRAIVISSLGFALHHVIVLAHYFGWMSWLTWFFTLSVAVGGAVWAWLYQRSGSLLPSWLSHLLIDAGIFLIGYQLISAFHS